MPFARITLAELRIQLQNRYDGSPWWTPADADQALNDALLTWNALTGYWRQQITITIPAGDPYAAIPGTMVQGTAVSIGEALIPTSLYALSMVRPNWRRETTESGGAVPTATILWAPIALNSFVVWPASVENVEATIDGVRSTPVLVADGDFLDADDTVINILLGYALHCAALKAPAEILQRTEAQYKAFIQAAVDRNEALRSTEWYKRLQRISRQNLQQPVKVTAPDDSGGVAKL